MSRELNWAGHSSETISAWYETDAAVAELGFEHPYTQAAWRAEVASMMEDTEHG